MLTFFLCRWYRACPILKLRWVSWEGWAGETFVPWHQGCKDGPLCHWCLLVQSPAPRGSPLSLVFLHVPTGSVPGVGMGRGKSSPSSLTTGRRQQPRQTWRSCDFRGEKRLQRALGRGVRPKHFSEDHRLWVSSSCTQQDWARVSGPECALRIQQETGMGWNLPGGSKV